jgi:hypothetical protein
MEAVPKSLARANLQTSTADPEMTKQAVRKAVINSETYFSRKKEIWSSVFRISFSAAVCGKNLNRVSYNIITVGFHCF